MGSLFWISDLRHGCSTSRVSSQLAVSKEFLLIEIFRLQNPFDKVNETRRKLCPTFTYMHRRVNEEFLKKESESYGNPESKTHGSMTETHLGFYASVLMRQAGRGN